MARYTEEELQEAREALWVLGGGPERARQEHAELADAAIDELERAGWQVLQRRSVKEIEDYVSVTEIVVRMRSTVHILRWSTFNRFWMRDTGHGRVYMARADLGL